MTHGGQILMTQATYSNVKTLPLAQETKRMLCLGKFEMVDVASGNIISSVWKKIDFGGN
jgi:hypothetical protein